MRTTALDAAVAAAYGWSADISDNDVLRELLALNGGGPVSKPAATTRAGREARAASHRASEAPG